MAATSPESGINLGTAVPESGILSFPALRIENHERVPGIGVVMAGELEALEELLTNRIGLDTTSVGSQLILRAVKQRMRDLKLDDLAVYERQVRQSATELQELIEEVIVAESWFFRDERPFEWLRDYVRAGWLDNTSTPSPANS